MISCKAIFKVCGRFNKAIVSSSASLLTRNMSDSRQLRFYDGRTGSEFNDQESAFNFVKAFADKAHADGKKSVVFVGENHEDPGAHKIELDLAKKLLCQENGSTGRNLSLEFYERDIQPVMDEYLSGSIDYQTFLHDSRPPANHEDYKPLLEFCKGAGVPVVASNCARRYTRIVGREGRDKLEQLYSTNPAFYETALPPLPYGKASQKYCDKFKEIMGIVASGKDEERVMRMLDSQTLWDASMAHSIAKSWESGSDLTLQVCGYFHCQFFLGIGEHLSSYYDNDAYQTFTVVVYPEDPAEQDFKPGEHKDIADLLILSDISKLL